MQSDKQIIIDEILERINSSPFTLVVEYTGMTVPQFADLRNRLAEKGAELHVSKNALVKRAAETAGPGVLWGQNVHGQAHALAHGQLPCA